jgi:hypothetical protein
MLGREGMTNGEGMAGGRRQIRGNWPSSLQQMQGVSYVTCWGLAGNVLGNCKMLELRGGEFSSSSFICSMILWVYLFNDTMGGPRSKPVMAPGTVPQYLADHRRAPKYRAPIC